MGKNAWVIVFVCINRLKVSQRLSVLQNFVICNAPTLDFFPPTIRQIPFLNINMPELALMNYGDRNGVDTNATLTTFHHAEPRDTTLNLVM